MAMGMAVINSPIWRDWGRLSVVLAAALLLAACEEEAPALNIQPGEGMPPLQVLDLDRQPHVLEAMEGKLLMVNVWATWCGPCRHELPSLQRMAGALGSERFALVGMSVDHDEHLVREYLIERDIRFPTYLDPQLAMANGVLGIRVFPSSFLIDEDGRLAGVIEGWRDWDAPETRAEIRALLPPKGASSVESAP
jgi:thiol-disulfide isomerase/thioredoxin